MSVDWQAIQSEYEQGASLRQLAAKYEIGKSTIERHAKMGQWDNEAGQRDTIPTPKKGDGEREAIQAIFLATFEKSANITDSCKSAGIDRSTFYDWMEKYEQFSMLYHQAEQIANDAIRAEIFRRGHDGFEEQVIVGGKVQTLHKYSDTLLIFLAKARMPEFREKQSIDVNTNTSAVEIYKVRIPDNGRNES